MNADEQSIASLEVSQPSATSSTTFATAVNELVENVDYLSMDNQSIIMEQTGTKHEKWLSKVRGQRLKIVGSVLLWFAIFTFFKSFVLVEQCKRTSWNRIIWAHFNCTTRNEAFIWIAKIPEGRLKYDPRFRRHAIVFTKSFDYIVKNVAYREKLEQHFQALGERHTAFQGRGFDPGYWDTFHDCMRQTVSLWGRDKDLKTANTWHMLISFVLQNMKTGFNRASSRHLRCVPRPLHQSLTHSTRSNTRQGIDPIQFYKQFCLQQKKTVFHQQVYTPWVDLMG
ncbi:Globin [Dirofilaria immitis]|nr:Globin [Dirofilaria immitis]